MSSDESNTSSTAARPQEYPCKVFDEPFVWLLSTTEIFRRCANCFRPPEEGERLAVCGKCRLFRYCKKVCQVNDWFHHRTECRVLEALSHTESPRIEREVLFFGRLIHAVNRLKSNTENVPKPVPLLRNGQEISRNYESLMTNADAVKNSEVQYQYFSAVKEGICRFFGDSWLQIDDDELFTIFCRKIINTHEISDNKGNRLGQALDLGIAAYDHSCRPNIGVLYDGKTTIFRALEPGLASVTDVGTCFLSYCELMQTKEGRRKELQEKYHFHCMCDRCQSSEDDLLTSIKCPKETCQRPVLTVNKDQENTCPGCGEILPYGTLTRGLHKMEEIKNFVEENTNAPRNEARNLLAKTEELILECQKILPNTNVHLADLLCLYVQYVMMAKQQLENGVLFALEALPCLRLCYPPNFKPLGFHLLKIAYLLVLLKRFSEAVPYVQEALRIFTVWFGGEHNYAVQIGALLDLLTSGEDLRRERFDHYFRF